MLWKGLVRGQIEEENRINKLAVALLGSQCPKSTCHNDYLTFLPSAPPSTNSTLWYLQQHSFNVRKACADLIAFEDDVNEKRDETHRDDLFHVPQDKKPDFNKRVLDSQPSRKTIVSTKIRKDPRRINQRIHIDLTLSDEETPPKKKKGKNRKELSWLKKLLDRERSKKQTKVKIADAHSTDNFQNQSQMLMGQSQDKEDMPEISAGSKEEIDRCLVNAIDMCSVSTTVSTTDHINPGKIFWNDVDLFGNADYDELDFDVDRDFRDTFVEKEEFEGIVSGGSIRSSNDNADEGECSVTSNYRVDSYENISMMDNIVDDDINDQDILDKDTFSTIKRNLTNWSYLFNDPLINIDSSGDAISSGKFVGNSKLLGEGAKTSVEGMLGLMEKPDNIAKGDEYNLKSSGSCERVRDTLVCQRIIPNVNDSTLSGVSSTTSSCTSPSQSCLPSVPRRTPHVTSQWFTPSSSLSGTFDESGCQDVKTIKILPPKSGDARKMRLLKVSSNVKSIGEWPQKLHQTIVFSSMQQEIKKFN
uniref:RsgA_4 protein n=1 Tax=Fopius arisanus TaxID=64838 RepID=A0A0C9R7M8_9HYME